MNKYISVHVVACLTRQAISNLIQGFKQNENDQVKHLHSWCDTVAGRMINEWQATDKETLIDWLEKQNIKFRGDSEWLIQVQFEAEEGEVV